MTVATFTLFLVVTMLNATIAIALAHKKNRNWLLSRSGPAPFERESNVDDAVDIYGDLIEHRW